MSSSALDTYQNPSDTLDFERDATVVLERLRPALADVLEQLRPPVKRAADLRRRLSLSQKVTWGLFTAATARDARAIPSLLPGRLGMERFFEATAQQGVPPEVINRAREAFERFEEAVARHASSRDVFQTMVSELNGGRDEAGAGGADLKHKRAAFRANALLWGRKAEVSCGVRIVGPGAEPDTPDGVLINGMLGLQRTRLGVPIQTTERRWGWAMPGSPPEPLDPRETGPDAIGLLHDFCSQPLPEFRLCESAPEYRKYELVGDKLGASGEVRFFTGEISRGAPMPGSAGLEVTQFRGVGMPLGMYIGDILVHKDRCGTAPPDVNVYGWPLDGPREFRESDLLPLSEQAEYLGDGIDAARTPVIPRYMQLLTYAMERMGWDQSEFRVFRCRVEYPLLHTRIRMTLPCT
jgi:hypothetical protein